MSVPCSLTCDHFGETVLYLLRLDKHFSIIKTLKQIGNHEQDY